MMIPYHNLATVIGLTMTGLFFSHTLFGKKRKHKRSNKARKAAKPEDVSLSRHSKNVAKSTLLVSKIRGIEQDGAKINYLRKIDPYVFEELLLTAYELKGCKAIRNTAYSGDGGLDGQIIDKTGKRLLIQAKRYSGHIKRSHVSEFIKLCRKEHCGGLFIHTGKTSAATRNFARANRIKIVSGSELIRLLIE